MFLGIFIWYLKHLKLIFPKTGWNGLRLFPSCSLQLLVQNPKAEAVWPSALCVPTFILTDLSVSPPFYPEADLTFFIRSGSNIRSLPKFLLLAHQRFLFCTTFPVWWWFHSPHLVQHISQIGMHHWGALPATCSVFCFYLCMEHIYR